MSHWFVVLSQTKMWYQPHLETDRIHCGVDNLNPDKIKTMSLSHWFSQILRRMFKSPNQTSNQHPRRVTCHEQGLQLSLIHI